MGHRLIRHGLGVSGSAVVLWLLFLLADWTWPLPDPERVRSVLILAEDRTPLRAFADSQGVWRYPVRLDEVSPLYVEALLEYEDRWFYQHPGINPVALVRAGWQWLVNGKPVSGGSTLTMQVARILVPHSRDIPGKFQQIFRALQLEWHYSKNEILTFYLNLAPFGGPIEGVQTASFAWLHKSVSSLSHAEAALLTVLPQAPSRLRPDRHPELAQRYRDKVLRRMATQGIWQEETVADAMQEPVVRTSFRQPSIAPLFARRMKERAFAENKARLQTTLDANMQWAVENVLRTRIASLPDRASMAVLVMENRTGYVRAYAGSADFYNDARFGHVDMVAAVRSPGSTLKPFLYGMALDDGLIHSASLLSDVPLKLNDYAPQNFFRDFSGPISATQALQQSLNVPAVNLLQRLSPVAFVARLRNGGVTMHFPAHTEPNLSVILGGAGTRLEDLVRGFSAFGREGMTVKPRFMAQDPLVERRMLSPGAAWIIQAILREITPPEGSANHAGVAWKTGTSYGFRDAWAIGVSDGLTVGVWTGRPDGTPLPGRFGAYAAGPVLFDVFRALPGVAAGRRHRPQSVRRADICWPLGESVAKTDDQDCHVHQLAWILDGRIPPTLSNLQNLSWSATLQRYWVNPLSGLRVTAECSSQEREQHKFAQWPLELWPWLSDDLLQRMRMPGFDASCPENMRLQAGKDLRILDLDSSSKLYLGEKSAVSIDLRAQGGQGGYIWLVNGVLAGKADKQQPLRYTFRQAGDYVLTVVDATGAVDKLSIRVINNP